jgi:hypothetical protein
MTRSRGRRSSTRGDDLAAGDDGHGFAQLRDRLPLGAQAAGEEGVPGVTDVEAGVAEDSDVGAGLVQEGFRGDEDGWQRGLSREKRGG